MDERAWDHHCQWRTWYEQIAPRQTNFANDLPGDIVPRGVDVLNSLRRWIAEHCDNKTQMLGYNADDWSCFIMCVEEFWERHKAWDISLRMKRIAESAAVPQTVLHATGGTPERDYSFEQVEPDPKLWKR